MIEVKSVMYRLSSKFMNAWTTGHSDSKKLCGPFSPCDCSCGSLKERDIRFSKISISLVQVIVDGIMMKQGHILWWVSLYFRWLGAKLMIPLLPLSCHWKQFDNHPGVEIQILLTIDFEVPKSDMSISLYPNIAPHAQTTTLLPSLPPSQVLPVPVFQEIGKKS